MSEEKSFWSSLTGLITALGGTIGAIAALVGALYTAGIIGPTTKAEANSQKTAASTSAATSIAVANPIHRELQGRWQLIDRVGASSLSSYIKDEHRFDMWLTVDGNRVTGRAEKIAYNGPESSSWRTVYLRTLRHPGRPSVTSHIHRTRPSPAIHREVYLAIHRWVPVVPRFVPVNCRRYAGRIRWNMD